MGRYMYIIWVHGKPECLFPKMDKNRKSRQTQNRSRMHVINNSYNNKSINPFKQAIVCDSRGPLVLGYGGIELLALPLVSGNQAKLLLFILRWHDYLEELSVIHVDTIV